MKTLSNVRKPVHNKCYGVEVECFVSSSEYYKRINKYHQFWYAGTDGSLRRTHYGHEGIEFVSQPLPFNATLRQIDWLAKRVSWEHNASCGVHVHVSRDGVSFKRLRMLAVRLEQLTDNEFEILFGRAPNQYCQNTYNYAARYSCINFTNEHTIEFRMFSGGDAKWVKECVRRVKLMTQFKPNRADKVFEELLELFTTPSV